MKTRYTLKNKKRFYSIIFTLVFILISTLFASNVYGYKEPSYKQIMVTSGDSLWTIASQFCKGNDVRKYIYKIKKVNKLETSEIFAGTILKIPV